MHKIVVLVLVLARFARGRRAQISQENSHFTLLSKSHGVVEDDAAISMEQSAQAPQGSVNDLKGLAELLLAMQALHPGGSSRDAPFSTKLSEYGIDSAAVVQPERDIVAFRPWHGDQDPAYLTNKEDGIPVPKMVPRISQESEPFVGAYTYNQTQTQKLDIVGSLDKSDWKHDSKTRVRLIRGTSAARGMGKHGGSYRAIACIVVLLVSFFLGFKDNYFSKRGRNNSKGNFDESAVAERNIDFRHNKSPAGVVFSASAASPERSRTAAVQMSLDESREDTKASEVASEVDVLQNEGVQKDVQLNTGKQSFQLYPQRWVQLAYLSLFAFLSDWVCFAVAAEPATFQTAYGHDPATLIDLFLFTNVFFCFLEPTIVGRFGLRRVITAAGSIMSVGCLLRSGIPFTGMLPTYELVVAGTIFVGAAQPFFQCTPPLLSATWFGSNERALATATAINFNQIGIMTAFLVGGSMMSDVPGLSSYFSLMSVTSLILAAGAFFQFQERPPTPPTGSAAARIALNEGPDAPPPLNVATTISTMQELLVTPGFVQPLAAFVGSICISNLVSAFVMETLSGAGVTSQATIDLAGAGFQVAIVVGGIILGGYVDRTKNYKQVTLACLLGGSLLLLPLGISGVPVPVVLAALLGLGALIGPVQPINAELAVEVAYPADENAIEALQQLCGNFGSALLVPLAERLGQQNLRFGNAGPFERGDTLLLTVIAVCALIFFNTFDATLKRSAVDCEITEDDEIEGCEMVFDDER